jgi:acyl-[acyl carrier protein]--UDP-N-acetylglucosamine O-acyltransferase
LTRPSLITIGNDCYFNKGLTLLTHDWVTRTFIYSGREFLPSSGRITIGNNVNTAYNVTILKGVTIGDNVFIGANSVVTKDIPSNSIAAGSPCRVIMNIDEFHAKREIKCVKEAFDYAVSIQQRFNRKPTIADFREEFVLFVDGDKIEQYPEISALIKSQLGPSYDAYKKHHKAMFASFEEFLAAAGIQK